MITFASGLPVVKVIADACDPVLRTQGATALQYSSTACSIARLSSTKPAIAKYARTR
jgi:hypothetical protein